MKKLIFMLALLTSFALTTQSVAASIEGDSGWEEDTTDTSENYDTESTSNQNVKNRPFTPAEAADVINNSDKNTVTINF